MIIYAGGRTDLIRHYSEWLMKRFEEGYVLSRNPIFKNKVTRYELSPEKVDCIVFCSKDYRPILPRVHEITERFPTYFQYTITAYGRDVEPGIPSVKDSIQTLKSLSEKVGKRRVAWRYDPVFLTEYYTIERHFKTFEHIARELAGFVDCCIFNFVEVHKSLEKNMPELRSLSQEEKGRLAKQFGEIAFASGLPIQICSANGDYSRYGIQSCGCVNLDMLGRANGIRFRSLKHKGTRPGCQKIECRDIGAGDTCTQSCRYCYANPEPKKSEANQALHDPFSPLLIGHLKPSDTLQAGAQKSFLEKIGE